MTKQLLRLVVVFALTFWGATSEILNPQATVNAGIVNGIETGDRLANVGMLVGRLTPGGGWHWLQCSGTLIAQDVFLTAGHCVAPNLASVAEFGVAFIPSIPVAQESNPPMPPDVTIYSGLAYHHPNFDFNALFAPETDAFDLAVVRLKDSPPGISPAQIVPAGYFERFPEPRGIGEAGYGITSSLPVLGLKPFDWGVRRFTTGRLQAVFPAKITVAPAPGQICGGDSGGPGFPSTIHDLGHPIRPYVNVVSAVTSFTVLSATAAPCETASILYRLDTPQARDFLRQFVSLDQRGSE